MSASMGDLVDDAQRQMETLERARQGSDAAAVDDVACAWPVSYTHLTLPTIYSV